MKKKTLKKVKAHFEMQAAFKVHEEKRSFNCWNVYRLYVGIPSCFLAETYLLIKFMKIKKRDKNSRTLALIGIFTCWWFFLEINIFISFEEGDGPLWFTHPNQHPWVYPVGNDINLKVRILQIWPV